MASRKKPEDSKEHIDLKGRKLVKTYREAKSCKPHEQVLIEVSGEYAPPIMFLLNVLSNPEDQSPTGQLVRQLMQSAKPQPK